MKSNQEGPQPASGAGVRPPEPDDRGGVMSRLLAFPLFWKLVLSNIFLMATVGLVVAGVVRTAGEPGVPGAVLAVLLLGALAAAGTVSGWIVRLALHPLEQLEETTEAVRKGDLAARAPRSPLADRRLDRVRRVLNEMLDALDVARRRQKELSRRVLRAEERERELIASELYAGTAQTLAGVLVRLRVLQRNWGDEGSSEQLEFLGMEVRAALEEVRAVARRLRPPELDELGVRAALEAHARSLTDAEGIRVEFTGELPENGLSEDARLALFRVVQEALTNVARHARATRVSVRFQEARDGLVTEVTDNGVGFDPRELGSQDQARLGLLNMIERAGYAQGSIHVDAAPGEGTRVRLVLPWHSGEPETVDDRLDELLRGLQQSATKASALP